MEETEDILFSMAIKESQADEAKRKNIEKKRKEKEEKEKSIMVFDEITFDSSTVEKIHPKLYEVQVHHISELDLVMQDTDAVNVDGEFFLKQMQE